jgi:uncharacterized protein with GYD domain
MPTFLVTARFKEQILGDLHRISVAQRRDFLDAMAKKFKGRLSTFYLVGGTWRVLAVFEVAANVSSSLGYMLLSSGLFESDFRLGRLLNVGEVDQSLKSMGTVDQPWIGTAQRADPVAY